MVAKSGSRIAFLAGLAVCSLWTLDGSAAWPRSQRCYCPYGYFQPAPTVLVIPQTPPAAASARAVPYSTYYRAPSGIEPQIPYTVVYGSGYYGREPGQVWTSGSQSGVSEPVTDQPAAPLSYPGW
jgi:hypothetical protein